jgi:CHASE2 domain-containing sensor protein
MMAETGSFDRKARSRLPSRRMISATGFAITIGLPLLLFLMPTFLQYFDGKLYDVFLSRTSPGAHSDRILIVDIDDDSLREHGQWPWPRYKIARLLDRLAEAGAAAIGIDIMFPEKDRTSPANYRADLLQDLDIAIDITAAHPLPDHDQLLAEAISASPSVLGYQFLFEPTGAPFHGRLHPLRLTGAGLNRFQGSSAGAPPTPSAAWPCSKKKRAHPVSSTWHRMPTASCAAFPWSSATRTNCIPVWRSPQ